MPNESNLKPFTKNDPRINRAGRPKAYDLIHEIATRLCAEPSELADDPEGMSKLESIMRDWLNSKSFQKQLAVIQYAFGKIPEKLEVEKKDTTPTQIIIEWEETFPDWVDREEWERACRRALNPGDDPLEDEQSEDDDEEIQW